MSNFSQITAVILAGGLGTRLRKVVSERPKAMTEINGKPFIAYLLEHTLLDYKENWLQEKSY